MAYCLYRLKFSTGLHIGTDKGGRSLDDGKFSIHSDTIFSALCCESVRKGDLDKLYKGFENGSITISDALPYYGDDYFLPKPIVHTGIVNREESQENSKMLKKLEFIPVSAFEIYINRIGKGMEIEPERLQRNFGGLSSYTRVSLRNNTPQPYEVAYWRFSPNAGLYIIVRYISEDILSLFENTLFSLGLSGIGGKQTSGLGKFEIQRETLPQNLDRLLNDSEAEYQMLLGTALPHDEELDEKLSGGCYMIIRRGGFVRSANYSKTPRKKRTIYMLSPGSCLKSRFSGAIFDLSEKTGTHPVWRCGKTLFVGVRL